MPLVKYKEDDTCKLCGRTGIYAKGMCRLCYSSKMRWQHIHGKEEQDWESMRKTNIAISTISGIPGFIRNAGMVLKIDTSEAARILNVSKSAVIHQLGYGNIPAAQAEVLIGYLAEKTDKALLASAVYIEAAKTLYTSGKTAEAFKSALEAYSDAAKKLNEHVKINHADIARTCNVTRQAINREFQAAGCLTMEHIPVINRCITEQTVRLAELAEECRSISKSFAEHELYIYKITASVPNADILYSLNDDDYIERLISVTPKSTSPTLRKLRNKALLEKARELSDRMPVGKAYLTLKPGIGIGRFKKICKEDGIQFRNGRRLSNYIDVETCV